jgi:hypothetical protein
MMHRFSIKYQLVNISITAFVRALFWQIRGVVLITYLFVVDLVYVIGNVNSMENERLKT